MSINGPLVDSLNRVAGNPGYLETGNVHFQTRIALRAAAFTIAPAATNLEKNPALIAPLAALATTRAQNI